MIHSSATIQYHPIHCNMVQYNNPMIQWRHREPHYQQTSERFLFAIKFTVMEMECGFCDITQQMNTRFLFFFPPPHATFSAFFCEQHPVFICPSEFLLKRWRFKLHLVNFQFFGTYFCSWAADWMFFMSNNSSFRSMLSPGESRESFGVKMCQKQSSIRLHPYDFLP